MAGAPMDRHLERALALVADHDVHLGRLADETRDRSRRPAAIFGIMRRNAPATDLLVIGERQMQRLLSGALSISGTDARQHAT